MKYSLLIGTLNRPWAIENCIKSINAQTWIDYEIIIIDQSDDDITEEYIKTLNDYKIIYRHVNYKGLSKARNDAIKLATGDYLCLIDDDAYYDKDFLLNAENYLQKYHKRNIILSGYIHDNNTDRPFADYKEKNNCKNLTIREIVRTCPSAGLIIPMHLIDVIGNFDEKFGVGACYPACEETDLLLRAVSANYKVVYLQNLKLKHPYPIDIKTALIDYKKLATYYKGLGAMFKKNLGQKNIYALKGYYIEVWIKLLVKKYLFVKYKAEQTQLLIEGFLSGIKGYSSKI